MNNIPKDFEPIFRTSPFLDLIGPIYYKKNEGEFIFGLRIQEKHCNARNLVHGGVFCSLADIALGQSAAYKNTEPTPIVTTNLSIDYAGSAKLGDWIEVNSDVQKVGKRMAFANCYFSVGGKRIVRASGIFNVINV
jgi:acyl-coenzyme A thioesterase 13